MACLLSRERMDWGRDRRLLVIGMDGVGDMRIADSEGTAVVVIGRVSVRVELPVRSLDSTLVEVVGTTPSDGNNVESGSWRLEEVVISSDGESIDDVEGARGIVTLGDDNEDGEAMRGMEALDKVCDEVDDIAGTTDEEATGKHNNI